MLCVHCSTPVADEAKFCHSCGSMVSDAGGQAAATAAMDISAFAHLERMLRDEIKGEFVLGKMLGRGGMAVVYLAEETKLGRKVALKVLPPELTFGHGVDRFLREAKTAATLDHPHIIPIYRISAEGKLFWYAMKYLEGQSLEDVMREKGAFSLDETIILLEQVADALDYAHEHQVIHRDIKPANVMLDNRNRVIITDFGIAKALSEGALTASGSVIGTPYFMSPEQGMGKPVTGASDQYSVGVMAFRMLSGHVPYDGDSAIDILHKHCMMEIPRLEATAPHIPAHVCDAIEKTMAKKGPERFANITQFVKALKDPSINVTRPSARTVMIDSGELEKVNSGARAKVKPRAGAAAADRTVVASPPAGVKRQPAPAPVEKSKTGMWVAVAAVVLAAGGFGAWQLTKGASDGAASDAPASVVADAPTTLPTTPPADAGTVDGPAQPNGAGAQESASGAAATVATPPTVTREPDPAPVTPPRTPPREPVAQPRTQPQQRTPPQQTAPRPQTQVATTPPPAAAAATFSVLQLILPTPGVVSIDGVSKGERSRMQEQLTPGTHLVRVEREGFVARDTVLSMRAGDTLRVTLRMQEQP